LKESFPKSHRLLRQADFRIVMDEGRKTVCPELVVFCHPQPSDKNDQIPHHARLGIVVSKKVGNSVVRNRVKRRLREAFRKSSLENIPSGWDFVVLARAQASRSDSTTLSSSFNKTATRCVKPQIRATREASSHA